MDAFPRILVADDEPNLLSNIRYALETEAWEVEACGDGEAAWQAFRERRPDIVLLDILMPRADGLEVLKRIRSVDTSTPVMFLTSRDAEFDRVLGLELGADDYLCKPFSLRELVARLRALLRRSKAVAGTGPAAPSRAGGNAAIEIDPDRFEARIGGAALRLTLSEFRILASLLGAPGVVRTREILAAAAYPEDPYPGERAVDCHVKRLRRKMETLGASRDAIETIYGLGYRLAPETLGSS